MDIQKINKHQYTKKEFLELLEQYDYYNDEVRNDGQYLELRKIKGTLIDSLLDLILILDIKLDIQTIFHTGKDEYDIINNVNIIKKIVKAIPENTELIFDKKYNLKSIIVHNTRNTITVKFK